MYTGVGLLAVWVWQGRFGRLGRLLLMTSVPVILAALYGSYTRSVWMGTGLGVFLVLALTLHGGWRSLVLGGLLSASLLLALTRMDSMVSFQRELPGSYAGKSVELRGEIAYVSWKMFLDRPLLGFGFDQYPRAKLAYLADRSTTLDLEATRECVHHNTFLSLLTETGLTGLALYVAILATWARSAWRLARRADLPDWIRNQAALTLGALGLYCCLASFHEISYLSMNSVLLFFLAGITTGLQAHVTGMADARTDPQRAAPRSGALLGMPGDCPDFCGTRLQKWDCPL
jgi:O-antigen ligase